MTPPTADPSAELTPRQILMVLLPALAIVLGVGLWLWSEAGLLVWFDSAAAFLAGCFG